MTKMLQLEVPGGGKRVLLHSCCAPCSGAVLECLVANGIKPVVFFSNSNIVPREEYELRLRELRRYCDSLGVPLVEDVWDHEAWLDFVLKRGEGDEALTKALATAPERGPRCLNCFKFRLLRAAQYAATQGIPVLTTTLASSRWKSLDQVDEAGLWACGEMPGQAGHDVVFWPQNWRKGGLQPRRAEIICEQNFYNQNFCGCEFSRDSSTSLRMTNER
ncbi:MAG: epoxyqueuosine reductase QueH [Bacteroidales bacterium]|nr:epoxyqueuosine reductase QueH [Bacteroidales bacterium]